MTPQKSTVDIRNCKSYVSAPRVGTPLDCFFDWYPQYTADKKNGNKKGHTTDDRRQTTDQSTRTEKFSDTYTGYQTQRQCKYTGGGGAIEGVAGAHRIFFLR